MHYTVLSDLRNPVSASKVQSTARYCNSRRKRPEDSGAGVLLSVGLVLHRMRSASLLVGLELREAGGAPEGSLREGLLPLRHEGGVHVVGRHDVLHRPNGLQLGSQLVCQLHRRVHPQRPCMQGMILLTACFLIRDLT